LWSLDRAIDRVGVVHVPKVGVWGKGSVSGDAGGRMYWEHVGYHLGACKAKRVGVCRLWTWRWDAHMGIVTVPCCVNEEDIWSVLKFSWGCRSIRGLWFRVVRGYIACFSKESCELKESR